MKRFGLMLLSSLFVLAVGCGGSGDSATDATSEDTTEISGQDTQGDTNPEDVPSVDNEVPDQVEDLGWECETDAACVPTLGDLAACKKAICDTKDHTCKVADMDDGTACDDGDKCTADTTCAAGVCQGGTALVCNDDNLCTDDSCDAAAGCVYTNNTADCDDGDQCTDGDKCANGACVGGTDICEPVCGDTVCEDPETCTDCPTDCGVCPAECGNDVCEEGETCESCSADCSCINPCCMEGPVGQCTDTTIQECVCAQDDICCTEGWDAICVGEVATFGCGECPVVCGDLLCDDTESCEDCPGDCGVCVVCGDGVCSEGDENCTSCEADCGACEFCPGYQGTSTCCQTGNGCEWSGDGFCDCGGACEWDKEDCQAEGCGDGTCDPEGETCWNCNIDCGTCDFCTGYTGYSPSCVNANPDAWDNNGYCDCEGACGWDTLDCTEPVCGDGVCYTWEEDCATCAADCGACDFCPGYTGTDTCCQTGDPCGYELDGYCACDGACEWDKLDCTEPVCGDGVCYKFGEDCQNCEADCGTCEFCPGYTGTSLCCLVNGACDWAEDGYCDCKGACAWDSVDCLAEGCGDGTCDTANDENCENCVVDCGACVYCAGYTGTSYCCTEENYCDYDINSDCDCGGTCSWDTTTCLAQGCGDGTCDSAADENCLSCSKDCGACEYCPGYTGTSAGCSTSNPYGWEDDGYCDCDGMCDWDKNDCTEPVCGDGSCTGSETCSNCEADCGTCNFCAGYTGTSTCCTEGNTCAYDNDGYCDCDGACSWDSADCAG